MRNLEQELKLSLDRRQYDLLRQQADTLPTLQTNHYFWSDGMSENEMVRLREKDGVFVLCYKKRISNTDGITVSDEREMEIAPDFANKMIQQGISFETLKSTVGVNYENNLSYVGKLDTYRTKFMLEDWCIELDQNAYFDQVDYELECESRNVEQLSKLKSYLFYTFGIVPKQSTPKSQRFFEQVFSSKTNK